MRNVMKAVAIAAMLAFPVATFAQTAPAPMAKSAKAEKSSKKAATKTASGTVKSISDTSLVITRGSGKSAKEETFVVNSSTTKTGAVDAGAKVSVHYTMDGSNMVATAITASPAKASKGKSKK